MNLPLHFFTCTYLPPNRVKDGVNGWMTYTIRLLDGNVLSTCICFRLVGKPLCAAMCHQANAIHAPC